MSALTINQLYQALGRAPDPGGLTFWGGYTGPNLQSSFEAAARAAGETFDISRVSPLNAVSSGPSTISINAPLSQNLTLSSTASPLKQFSTSAPVQTVDLKLPVKTTTTTAPDLYGPPAPVTSPLNQVSSTVSTNVASTTVDPTKTYTAQDALDYFRSTSDTVGMYQILAASAGMPNLTDEQAAAGVVTNIAQKELGRDPDPVELKDYTEQILGGTPYGDVLAQVQGSPEAIERQRQRETTVRIPTVEDMVQSAAFAAVGEALDPAGVSYYAEKLRTGQLDPESLARDIAYGAKTESQQEKANEFLRESLGYDYFMLGGKRADLSDVPADVIEQIQQAAKSVYGVDIEPERLRRYATEIAEGRLSPNNLTAALAYDAGTIEEKARANTILGYNYHELDPTEQKTAQLREQYGFLGRETGYRYQNDKPENIDRILSEYSRRLTELGVENIYDISVKTVDVPTEINVFKRAAYNDEGSFTGNFDYLKQVGSELHGDSETPIFEPLTADELANLREIDQGEFGQRITTTTQVPTRVAFNNKTGEDLDIRTVNDKFYFGAVDDGKRTTAELRLDFTPDGVPIFYPEYNKRQSTLQKIAPIAAVFAMPFAPQIGAALGFTGTGATVAGVTAISAGSQLASTGTLDPGQLLLAAGTAYVGANMGFTGADIASDASQLAAQGLNASQIADVLAATGINAVSSNLYAGLAVAGVPASVAPVLAGGLVNGTISAFQAKLNDGDVSDAFGRGFGLGATGEISNKIMDDIVGTENIRKIAQELKLTPDQVRNLGVSAITNGAGAELTDQGNFGSTFVETLVSGGVGLRTANEIYAALDGKIPEKARAAIFSGARDVVSVSTSAAMNKQNVEDVLGAYAPSILGNMAEAISKVGPEVPAEEKDKQAGIEPIILAQADTGTMTDVSPGFMRMPDGSLRIDITGTGDDDKPPLVGELPPIVVTPEPEPPAAAPAAPAAPGDKPLSVGLDFRQKFGDQAQGTGIIGLPGGGRGGEGSASWRLIGRDGAGNERLGVEGRGFTLIALPSADKKVAVSDDYKVTYVILTTPDGQIKFGEPTPEESAKAIEEKKKADKKTGDTEEAGGSGTEGTGEPGAPSEEGGGETGGGGGGGGGAEPGAAGVAGDASLITVPSGDFVTVPGVTDVTGTGTSTGTGAGATTGTSTGTGAGAGAGTGQTGTGTTGTGTGGAGTGAGTTGTGTGTTGTGTTGTGTGTTGTGTGAGAGDGSGSGDGGTGAGGIGGDAAGAIGGTGGTGEGGGAAGVGDGKGGGEGGGEGEGEEGVTPLIPRRVLVASGPGTPGVLPSYPYKPTDPRETWLGGRFRPTADLVAALGLLLAKDNPQMQEAKIFSALRRASGLEDRSPETFFEPSYYSYGKETSPSESLRFFRKGGPVQEPISDGKMSMSPLLMASGSSVPHKGSHYVQGAGGGQDDLIPAQLADGEYVFDAEIVAALGDGSNKEGAKILDKFREEIRKHKRNGSTKTIPPKAKSPLAYLRSALS